ncbi:MAG: MBL fold metallo-hydrolase, partial [Pseudomonadota bacterium]
MPDLPLFEDFDHGITAIDTGYVRPRLDASHLIADGGELAFVDCGTTHSVPGLLDALAQKQFDPADVKFLFLTHIHLDHAGGAGALMQALPNATAVLHPRGARHMVEPAKLIKGSIAVYGEETFRELYGDVVPIDESRVKIVDDGEQMTLGSRRLEFLHTEGHARHHYCIADPASDGIFTGDSFGIAYRPFTNDNGAFVFPTTTPVHFDPE